MKTPPSEKLVVDPVVDVGSASANSPTEIASPSRRKFLGNVGGVTAAAMTVGAIGLSPLLGLESTKAQAATTSGRRRAALARTNRVNAANAEFNLPFVPHPNNGDEILYAKKIGNFSKGLEHNSLGEVVLSSYNSYLHAIQTGNPSDFENIVLGGTVKLVDPQAGLAFGLEGTDGGNLAMPPCPAVASQERADEAVEVYWMALLRDTAFTNYATDPTVAQACTELSGLSGFTGPRINGQVTSQTLFRGFTAGDIIGPYISQFLLQPLSFGALPITQQYVTYQANTDYMTDPSSWLAVQNGQGPFAKNIPLSQVQYLKDGRGVGAWVHIDVLYEAYFMGMLWLLADAGFNASNPYNASHTQSGFGTFGAPHVAGLLAEVSGYALRAQWYQKFWVHRALRPEAFGGLVQNVKTGLATYPLNADVLNSQAVAQTFTKYGSYLLPIAFPEGSPQHPSYASGHGTVAGACVTILKAFFNTDNVVFPNPMVPTTDGLSLESYTGSDVGQMTLTGELNKLASNIAQGRNIAGVHWRSDAVQAMLLGEQVAISILTDQAFNYNENFAGFTFTKFDGTVITIPS